jgi:hypothetical protein
MTKIFASKMRDSQIEALFELGRFKGRWSYTEPGRCADNGGVPHYPPLLTQIPLRGT